MRIGEKDSVGHVVCVCLCVHMGLATGIESLREAEHAFASLEVLDPCVFPFSLSFAHLPTGFFYVVAQGRLNDEMLWTHETRRQTLAPCVWLLRVCVERLRLAHGVPTFAMHSFFRA